MNIALGALHAGLQSVLDTALDAVVVMADDGTRQVCDACPTFAPVMNNSLRQVPVTTGDQRTHQRHGPCAGAGEESGSDLDP